MKYILIIFHMYCTEVPAHCDAIIAPGQGFQRYATEDACMTWGGVLAEHRLLTDGVHIGMQCIPEHEAEAILAAGPTS